MIWILISEACGCALTLPFMHTLPVKFSHCLVYMSVGAFILGYTVQWEEESMVVSCTHTLIEATTNSEVFQQTTVGVEAIEVTFRMMQSPYKFHFTKLVLLMAHS